MSSAFASSDLDALDTLLDGSAAAAGPWAALPPAARAAALRRVADELDAASSVLVPIAADETHLPVARLNGEVVRTTSQLRLFAEVLDDGAYLEVTIDNPDGGWASGPRPDVRRMLTPLGPAVVFAASNFPFAFSVAGGDTASALAAGCPVVVKAHPGHPRLSAATAEIVTAALGRAGAPEGTFALISGEDVGRAAVVDPRIRVGAFTGSQRGGRALWDIAVSRPDPIPFYAELGSLNPVFVTPGAAAARCDEIVAGFVASYTFGAGQLCTKPGLMFVPAEVLDLDVVADAVRSVAGAPLLNEHIRTGYDAVLSALRSHPAVRTVVAGSDAEAPSPTLLTTTVAELLAGRGDLLVECFGPTSIVVTYADESELLAAAAAFDGQLTATLHALDDDPAAPILLDLLSRCAGRVVWNGWPTGVSVTWAMQHGGPWPATTTPTTTSVGTAAIGRFVRPVAYQAVPDALLPAALQDANPLRLPRRVNGHLELL